MRWLSMSIGAGGGTGGSDACEAGAVSEADPAFFPGLVLMTALGNAVFNLLVGVGSVFGATTVM